MFENLTERLSATIKKLTGGGVLSEAHVDEALKEIRRSLLEADVHFKVAKDACDRIKQKAIGAKIWEKLSPGQQVVQIFKEELVELLGGVEQKTPDFGGKPPVVVVVAGLQGSGKTTFCSKLGLLLKKKMKKSVGLIPADCARPAAKTQLQVMGEKVGVSVFDSRLELGAVEVVRQGLAWAQKEFFDVVIVDTAGRIQIDSDLMDELKNVCDAVQPAHKILVLDSMLGSQGLDVSKTFHEKITVTGLCLSKLDGDARGGVALSARFVTGVPIQFIGTGEKPEDLEFFHPTRMADRVLGMGDVLSLIEKAQESMGDEASQEAAMKSAQKMMKGDFDLEDFRDQLKRLQNLGPLEGLMKMIPGMGQALKQMQGVDPQKELKRVEAMIGSMTPQERRNHTLLNGSRKLRISKGSGIQVAEINRFLKQFVEMQKMMKQFTKLGLGKGGLGMLSRLSQFKR
ncbi:MAG: signal recognition particle protein [Bacteriovoracia bacterium]